LFTFC